MDRKVYNRTIANKCLGLQRQITGSSLLEVKIKAEVQLAKWARMEKLHKEREQIESLKDLAEFNTRQARNTIEACGNILKINLFSDTKLDWVSFYDDRLYPPFVFQEHPPRYEQIARKMQVPRKSFFGELLFPSLREKRLALEKAAEEQFEEQMREYNMRKDSALKDYELERSTFINTQREFNRSIDQLQLDVEKGLPDAVASLVRIALALLELPDEIEMDFDAHYFRPDRLIVISGFLPGPQTMPRTVRYEYRGEENGIFPVEMDKTSFDNFYESTMLQIALSAIHRIFKSIPDRQINMLGFNGLTGEDKSCILTCKISRDLFDSIDLAKSTPGMSFQAMKGILIKPLTGLIPVEPIVRPENGIHLPPDGGAAAETNKLHKSAYRPGDIKNAANNLLVSLLDQLEQDLSKKTGDKDLLH